MYLYADAGKHKNATCLVERLQCLQVGEGFWDCKMSASVCACKCVCVCGVEGHS